MNHYNSYGTWFVETEAIRAITEDDHPYARQVLDQMTQVERRTFRRQLFLLYWFVSAGLTSVDDIEEMMGELMRIANDTAPDF